MSNVVRLGIENKVVSEIQILLNSVSAKVKRTRFELTKPPFRIDVTKLAKLLISRELNPAIKELKQMQQKVETLKRMKIARAMVLYMQKLVDDLLIDVVLAKKRLEELRLRSTAPIEAQAVISQKLAPALEKIEEIKVGLDHLTNSKL